MTKTDSLESDIASLAQTAGISRSEAIGELKILFAHANGLAPLELIKEPSCMLEPTKVKKYKSLLQDRLQGKPIAYILGYKEFYGLPFKVNECVLTPRPETELLVDLAIEKIQRHNLKTVLELGTGSGAIAISLAAHLPDIEIIATDISVRALEVAASNAKTVCPDASISFVESDWFSEISNKFDLIVSNPPYIAESDIHLQRPGVCYEPTRALVSGPKGLDALSLIVRQSKFNLRENGWLLIEHGYDQLDSCRQLLIAERFTSLLGELDLSGNPRVSGGRIPVDR